MIYIACKICGHRHPAGELCAKNNIEKLIKAAPDVLKTELTKPYDLKAGYNAYMRDYMAKRRAAIKAAKS